MTNMIKALSQRLAVLFMLVLGAVGVGQMAIAADNQLTGMRLGMIELNGAPALRIVIETSGRLYCPAFLRSRHLLFS